ncbi:MAG: glucokinase [Acidimicrobiaceae bacterium]|nr:glucokinase [Acidimicrobiaceae bacterium]
MRTIGVDVGGTKCFALALDDDGAIAAERRVPTPKGAEAIVAAIVEVAGAVRDEVGEVPGIGIGMPGLIERTGVLRFAPNLPGVLDLDLRAALAPHFQGIPFEFDNDATCAGLGEWAHGAAQGVDNALLVTLGTGIGGGIMLDGRPFSGAHGFAGEIGHMVVDPHGPPCPCGKRGCWERYASGSGLGRLGRDAAHAGQATRIVELAGGDPENVKGEHVSTAAAEGDAEAAAVIADFGWWLALGLANLANIFDPERFVLGGGLAAAGDLLFEPARAAFADLVEAHEHRPPIEIVPAQLGERAGAIGAAVLARNVAARA